MIEKPVRKLEPIGHGAGAASRRPGHLRRTDLRNGGLPQEEERSATLVDRTRFPGLVQIEIERALGDELTLIVLQVRLRPPPGSGDDGFADGGLPTEVIHRLGQCHEHLRAAVFTSTEIMMVVPSLRRRSDGEQLVASLLELLAPPIEIDGLVHHLSPTIGAAMLDHDSPSAELLISDAKSALLECDSSNPGRIFHPCQRVGQGRGEGIERDLRAAVLNHDITAALQPTFRVADGELIGFEAFARWNRSGRGPVPAMEFVPMAHDLGLDHYLNRQVLNRSLRTLSETLDAAPIDRTEGRTLWLNVTPREVTHPEFEATIIGAMEVDRRIRVGLELSPSPPGDAGDVHRRLKRLVAMGARVAIGDFGIGNANLTIMRQLPFDAVRLDRALIRQIAGNGKAADMVKALIDMAALLDLETTAQGVENQAQLDVLKELDCEAAQGYFYGEPTADKDTLLQWFMG